MVWVCDICNTEEECDEQHKASDVHRFNYALKEFNAQKKSISNNRHGVELKVEIISVNGFNYGFSPEFNHKGHYYLEITPDNFRLQNNKLQFRCIMENKRRNNKDSIYVTFAGILHPYKAFSMHDPNNNLADKKLLQPGAVYETIVTLTLHENHVGNFKIPIYFSIQSENEKQEMQCFSIARSIIVSIYEKKLNMENHTLERSPFTHNKWEKVKVIPPRRSFKIQQDVFTIPKKYWLTLMWSLEKDPGNDILQEILQKLSPKYVTLNNYKDFFHILLWLEEVCAVIGLSSYNMENVHLQYKNPDILVLEVPGLAEKRPSVVKGDSIQIKIHGDHTSYEGVIQTVGDKTVDIYYLDYEILDIVQKQPDIEIDVRFVLGRIHYERMHLGVEQVVANGYVKNLFPVANLANRAIREPHNLSLNELLNKQIYNNKEQLTAVIKILNNTSKGAPYVVYGPPGTGKTVTIVEAIYQLKRLTNYKILVCAPANAACNMLAERLATFCTTNELARIMSENCDTGLVPINIKSYCNLYSDENGTVATNFLQRDLNKFRIIVTTLVFAGKYNRKYHPDVVFIDEAAQALEPEACCAIGLLTKDKQLILAGDPKQLGPVVRSSTCKEYGYDISILERLMKLPLYENDTKNNFITMLKLNFRSHSEILRIPNKMFYDNQLKAVSPRALSDPLGKIFVYKLIYNKNKKIVSGFPVEFCSVIAKERREGRSPSYFNDAELLMVYKYIKAITSIQFDDPSDNVTAKQIGVVTPYIRQVYQIRYLLRTEFRDVEVGTTEAFQGREKRVIIISTVRAQEDLLLYDKMYKLGFVREPKRFNVAVTRAKSKLIVIGNPLVLITDNKFRELMKQAKDNGTYCGTENLERTREVRQQIARLLRNVKLKDR